MLTQSVSFLHIVIMVIHSAIISSRAEDVFTIADYRLIKGEDFCKTRKQGFILENICFQIADENGFEDYIPEYIMGSCRESCKISIFDKSQYDFVTTKEDLLQCRYNLKQRELINGKETTVQFASRAIGKGKEETDVMEYKYDEIARPYENRTGLLNRVRVMVLEQYYDKLKGNDFCVTKKNSEFLNYMCEKVALKNNIADYTEVEVKNTCQETRISMYSIKKRQQMVIKGQLLICNYIRDGVQFTSGALGRGKEKNDVMEYTLDDDVAQPRVNRPDLLNEVHVLTMEQYELLEGEEFCVTRKDDGEALKNLCIKLGDANDFQPYRLKEFCNKTTITLFSETENKLVTAEEDLLFCMYEKITRYLSANESVYERFATKALGRGKKQNDAMEYDYSYSPALATPFANRSGFLDDINPQN